jgi:hypothetical protein
MLVVQLSQEDAATVFYALLEYRDQLQGQLRDVLSLPDSEQREMTEAEIENVEFLEPTLDRVRKLSERFKANLPNVG